MATTLTQDALALRKLKKLAAALDKKAKLAKAEYATAEHAFLQRMEGEDTQSIKAGGTLFCPTKTIYAKVDDREAFLIWAEENDSGLYERKERKGLLNELVREHLDNNEELPPGLGMYVDEYVSLRAG